MVRLTNVSRVAAMRSDSRVEKNESTSIVKQKRPALFPTSGKRAFFADRGLRLRSSCGSGRLQERHQRVHVGLELYGIRQQRRVVGCLLGLRR